MIVGIDLGTTNSVIAIPGQFPEVGKVYGNVTVIGDEVDRLIHASAVCMVDGELIVGDDAKLLATEGYSPVRFVKKYMGSDQMFPVGGENWTPEQVSAAVLRHLCNLVNKRLGVHIDRAVVTHPAYFDGLAITATKKAAELAGLRVEGLLQVEPVAAAMMHTRNSPGGRSRVLVYDLGGGTFDATIVYGSGGVFRILANGGDREMGGYNFDKKIAGLMLAQLKSKGYVLNIDENEPERDPRWASLMYQAEQMKLKLSEQPKADVRAAGIFKDDSSKAVQLSFSLTRDELEKLIEFDVNKTIRDTHAVLKRAEIKPEEIDDIVMVGGSSRIPMIQRRLAEEFGKQPVVDDDVLDLSVGIGAAMMAATAGTTEDGVYLASIPQQYDDKELDISGRVIATDEYPEPSNFTVVVSGGCDEVSTVTGPDGKFLVTVELEEDEEHELKVVIETPSGDECYCKTFPVALTGEPPPPPPPPAVLPKAISLNTKWGLKTIAEENVALPLKDVVTFRTTEELTEIPIEVFQEEMQLTTLLLTGFERPMPANSSGQLVVEINADYSMQVTAAVPAASISKTQKVQLTKLVIPKVEELRIQFEELKALFQSTLENTPDGEAKARVAAECERLIEEIERLLADQHPERMQTHILQKQLLRQIKALPSSAALSPLKSEMDGKFAEARSLLPRAVEKQPALADQRIEDTLNVLEEEAARAYQQSNAANWSRISTTLDELVRDLKNVVEPPSDTRLPPPPITQQIIAAEIQEKRNEVAALKASGKLTPEVAEKCEAELDQASRKINAVDLDRGDAANNEMAAIYRQHVMAAETLMTSATGKTAKAPPIEIG